jgi:hypothetical protein
LQSTKSKHNKEIQVIVNLSNKMNVIFVLVGIYFKNIAS